MCLSLCKLLNTENSSEVLSPKSKHQLMCLILFKVPTADNSSEDLTSRDEQAPAHCTLGRKHTIGELLTGVNILWWPAMLRIRYVVFWKWVKFPDPTWPTTRLSDCTPLSSACCVSFSLFQSYQGFTLLYLGPRDTFRSILTSAIHLGRASGLLHSALVQSTAFRGTRCRD